MAKKRNVVEVTDPNTGEIFDINNIDDVLAAIARTNECLRTCYSFLDQLKGKVLTLASFPNGQKTAYVMGERFKAKIEKKSDSFDSETLGTVRDLFMELGEKYIKPAGWKIGKRDYDMLMKTAGPPTHEAFKEALSKALRPATGAPSVSVVPLDEVK